MRTAKISIFITVVIVSVISVRTPVHAQSMGATIEFGGENMPWNRGVPLEQREAAKMLFVEGNRLFMIPLFAPAAEKYAAALDQWKHPAFYFNLALTQLNLGHDVEARDSLEQAVRHGAEPLGVEQYQEAQKQLQELQQQLGRIRVTCLTQGAEITLDGATLFIGPGNYEGWVKAKAHEVTAKKPEYLPKAHGITVSPGELKTVDLTLVTLSETTIHRWAIWKPWAVVAMGAVVAAASGGLHALSRRDFDKYDDGFKHLQCANSPGCTQEEIGPALNARLSRARLEQEIAVGGYIAGGFFVTAGAVLLYLNRPRLAGQETTNSLVSSSTSSVVIVPAISTQMFGILLIMNH